MQPKVYIETSVISYLASMASRDLVVAAHQQLTHDWWATRHRFELYVSDIVVGEAARGDAGAAARRAVFLDGLPVLATSTAAEELAGALVRACALPAKAAVDAMHIAVGVVNGMDYLVTWNCSHIANATMRHRIEETCLSAGFQPPIICTPEELVEPPS